MELDHEKLETMQELCQCLDVNRDRDQALVARATKQLLVALGKNWAPPTVPDAVRLAVVHVPTAIEFVAVPGGYFDMGLSEQDIEKASEYVDLSAGIAGRIRKIAGVARPVHGVSVQPFLCSTRLLDCVALARLGVDGLRHPTVSRSSARHLAAANGFRLPSEAELEWLARDGGLTTFTLDAAVLFDSGDFRLVSRFGVGDINEGTWAEDDWHPDYVGAPGDSRPWMNGDDVGTVRGEFWLMAMQSEEELIDALAAVRGRGVESCRVRLALTLQLPANSSS